MAKSPGRSKGLGNIRLRAMVAFACDKHGLPHSDMG